MHLQWTINGEVTILFDTLPQLFIHKNIHTFTYEVHVYLKRDLSARWLEHMQIFANAKALLGIESFERWTC